MLADIVFASVYNVPMRFERHKIVDDIHKKLLALIDDWIGKGYSAEKIGDICGLSKIQIYGLLKKPGEKGYRGANLSLNTAIRIWEGLGHPPETLIADCNVAPLLAEKIKRIQASEYNELFELCVEVLKNWEYINEIDAEDLIEIRTLLKSLKRRITATKGSSCWGSVKAAEEMGKYEVSIPKPEREVK